MIQYLHSLVGAVWISHWVKSICTPTVWAQPLHAAVLYSEWILIRAYLRLRLCVWWSFSTNFIVIENTMHQVCYKYWDWKSSLCINSHLSLIVPVFDKHQVNEALISLQFESRACTWIQPPNYGLKSKQKQRIVIGRNPRFRLPPKSIQLVLCTVFPTDVNPITNRFAAANSLTYKNREKTLLPFAFTSRINQATARRNHHQLLSRKHPRSRRSERCWEI